MTARARVYASITSRQAPPPPATRRLGRALVLGGSVAGLMAARVLADHADEVLVIEPDDAEVGAGPRPGVPQGSQVHALLAAGQLQLDRWFPGFTAQAEAGGALPSTPAHVEFYIDGVARPSVEITDVPGLLSSRPFLESLIRRRTLEFPGIRVLAGRATGLRIEGDAVLGATYAPNGDAGAGVDLDADLVVDATGRGSRLADWLEQAGRPAPPLVRMPIKLNYATAVYRRDPKVLDTTTLVNVCLSTPVPGRLPRTGGFVAAEDDRWIVLVAGYDQDRPERSLEDFTTRCRRDFPGMFGDIVDHCELLGDVVTYHQADSRRRDYDTVARFPARLIVAGDAVASFNPVYGQGMTSAMLHASCLSAYLRGEAADLLGSGGGGTASDKAAASAIGSGAPSDAAAAHPGPDLSLPAKPYFDLVRVIVDAAWQTSTFPDLALPHVPGPYPRGYRLAKRVSESMLVGSVIDPELNLRLARVTGMLTHPDTLMSPGTVVRSLRSGRRFRKTHVV